MLERCVITLTKGHILKVKVKRHTQRKSVPGLKVLAAKLDMDNISDNALVIFIKTEDQLSSKP